MHEFENQTYRIAKEEGVPHQVIRNLQNMWKNKKAQLYDENDVVATFAAQILHRNFNSAPMEYRTAAMREVLFPSHPNARPIMHKGKPIDIQKYVFDTAMPLRKGDEYIKYGRSLIGNYLESIDKAEKFTKQMYTAAIMVAEDPGLEETDPQKRTGMAIHTLLRSMDNPLAAKTSQAIDSTPGIPDWLRNPASKNSENIPPRWVIHEMFQKNASPEVKQTTKRIGAVRAGAIGLALTLDKDINKLEQFNYPIASPRTVFKIVRGGARQKVALHEHRVISMVNKSAAAFPELASAKPIIQHAVNAAKVETEFTNAPKQTEIATTLTDGMKVTIGERTFTFREVPIMKDNKTSHEMVWAPGKLFNELAAEDKKAVAQALFAAENYVALSGFQMDWDRHGAQAIINGDTIYLIDRGGMAIDPPSVQDRQLFGKTLADAFNNYVKQNLKKDGTLGNKLSFEKAFTDAVDATADKATGQINNYLAAMSRGQHNMGDLRRELEPAEQLKALGAVFFSGNIDEHISAGLMDNLSPKAKEWISTQALPTPDSVDILLQHPNPERWQELNNVSALMKKREQHKNDKIDWDIAEIPTEPLPPAPAKTKYDLPVYEMETRKQEEFEIEEEIDIDEPEEPQAEAEIPGSTSRESNPPNPSIPSSSRRRNLSEEAAQQSSSTETKTAGPSGRLAEAGIGLGAITIGMNGLKAINKELEQKKQNGEETTWRDRVRKGALCFAVVTGVAMAVDAMTGGHAMRAMMGGKSNSAGWRARA